MQRHAEARGRVRHQAEQPLVVGAVDEDGLAVVAALDHVVRQAGKREAGQTGHGVTSAALCASAGVQGRRNRVSPSVSSPNCDSSSPSRAAAPALRWPVWRARISSFFMLCSQPTSSVTVTL